MRGLLCIDLLVQASTTARAGPDIKADPDLKCEPPRPAPPRASPASSKSSRWWRRQSGRPSALRTATSLLYSNAKRQMEHPFELRRRVLGEGHPDTLGTLHSVAELYRLQGKYTQAWPLFRKVLELRRRVLGGEHRDTLSTMNDFALLYLYQGKYAQSEAVFAEVLRGRRRVLGEQHLDTLSRAIWRCYTGTNENIQTPAVAYEGCGLAAARARCRASGYADQHE